MRKIYAKLFAVTLFSMLITAFPFFTNGQSKPETNKSKEIINDEVSASKIVGNTRVETKSGIVVTVFSPDYAVTPAEPDVMAKQYLNANTETLMPGSKSDDIQHLRTIETPGGFKVHFKQFAEGYPVYGASTIVSINKDNKVVFVTNSYKRLGKINTNIVFSETAAIEKSKQYLNITGQVVLENVNTVVYNIDRKNSVVAYKVNVVPAQNNFGDWELIIDASSGTILRAEDKACYHLPQTDTVNGSGWVFDPDPVTNAAAKYGVDGFEDNNDIATDSVAAQVKTVELRDISYDAGMYKLEGPYAVIVDVESPFTGLHEQDSANFHHPRNERSFEATQIYYHVDHSMRYVNDSLGFNVMPFQYEGGVQFDPHGVNDGVNAHYVSSSGFIAFGSPPGRVDLGEDNAVVLHELGHGIHDWITNGDLSQVDGLSEGLSDYWAQSYSRSFNKYQPGDEGYDWFGSWGGQSWGSPSLRVTNYDAHYPEDLTGAIHTDGQMWSSSLMSIYDEIGRYATDMDFWEAISMLNGSSGQVDAALAFIQADKDLFDGDNLDVIIDVFTDRGYLSGSIFIEFSADTTGGIGPLTVNFTDASTSFLGEITTWEWDFDGDGVIDSYDQNPTHTYTEVGAYTVGLRVSDGTTTTSLVKPNHITVNGGFFVFETAENMRDHSGAFQREFLMSQGFDVVYGNSFPSSLYGFDACFFSMGNYNSGYTELTNDMADILADYLLAGGKVYIESSDALGYDQANNDVLRILFGLANATDGSNSNEINSLTGADGALTQGMEFISSKQTESGWIDIFTPSADTNSMAAFTESSYGIVGVQNTGSDYNQQTFCFSYAMAEMVDNNAVSSRYYLMVQLLNFFGYPLGTDGLVANFEADKSSVLPDEEIMFTDWSVSDDANPVNSWKWDFNNDGTIDSEEQNPAHTYNEGGIYDVMLIVSNGVSTDTVVKKGFVAVRSGILVFEGKNVSGYSGQFINDVLHDYSYEEISYTNKMPEDLSGYDVVLLSFGNSGNQSTELTSSMANAINDYGFDGGRIYLEGSDVLSSNSSLWTIFGLLDADGGGSNALTSLMGQDNALTYGMEFSGSSQFSVNSIDTYIAIDDASIEPAFSESDYGIVAIQVDGSATTGHKSFAFSYALADLEDSERSNTRTELLLRILNFFDIVSDVDENFEVAAKMLKVYPNPTRDQITLEFDLELAEDADIVLYDLSGRMISSESQTLSRGVNRLNFNVQNLPEGMYYFNLKSDSHNETVKWLKVK